MWIYIESHAYAINIVEAYSISTEMHENTATVVLRYKGIDEKDAEARLNVAIDFDVIKKMVSTLLSQLKQLSSYQASQELEDAIMRSGSNG